MNRHTFLKICVGAGVTAGGGTAFLLMLLTRRKHPSMWVRITSDDTTSIVISKAEMGQGILTSMCKVVADELEADWSRVRPEWAPYDDVYMDIFFSSQTTGASTSVRGLWEPLRIAGALTRQMLMTAAARRWKVPQAECRATDGQIMHVPTGRSLRFGALAESAAQLNLPTRVRLKNASEFRLIGQSTARLDSPAKVRGEAVYGLDVNVPGMLIAQIEQCPYPQGKIRSYEASTALSVEGVRQVVTFERSLWSAGPAVAVVAESYWAAQKGREALRVVWTPPAVLAPDSAMHLRALYARLEKKGTIIFQCGNPPRRLENNPGRLMTASYDTPMLAHAPMEPMACVAHIHDDICEVWAPGQNMRRAHRCAMEAAGVSSDAVVLHSTYLGGSFGRRLYPDYVGYAVELSRRVRAPVKVVWTRADDLQHDFYHPATCSRLVGQVDEHGEPIMWHQRVAGDGPALLVAAGLRMLYKIPAVALEYSEGRQTFPTGARRSVGHYQNVFYRESFLDELAHAGQKDPYLLRRSLCMDMRLARVIDVVAQRSEWYRSQNGRALGIAADIAMFYEDPNKLVQRKLMFSSFDHDMARIALVAEVMLSPNKAIQISHVYVAVDCGIVVDPSGVRAQVEGGIAFGLTPLLKGGVSIKNGRVAQSNFHDHALLRSDEMPLVTVDIIPSNEPPLGVAEASVPIIAPAVCNAIYALTGHRFRTLPINLLYLST